MLSERRRSPQIFWDQIDSSVCISSFLLMFLRIFVHTIFIVRCLSQGWPFMPAWRGNHLNPIIPMPRDLASPSPLLWCHTKTRLRSSLETEGKVNFMMTDFVRVLSSSYYKRQFITTAQNNFTAMPAILTSNPGIVAEASKKHKHDKDLWAHEKQSNNKWLDESKRTPQRHHLNARSYNNNIQNQ